MALFPVYANERDAVGLFNKSSGFTGGEGGLVVRVTAQGTNSPTLGTESRPVVDYVDAAGTNYSTAMYALLDEQQIRPETLIGSYLPQNSAPVGIGPATWLGSGKLSIWQNKGYFLTDNFQIQRSADGGNSFAGDAEGYGQAVNLTAGSALLATNANSASGVSRGTLCDAASASALGVATATTRLYFISLVVDASDLLAGLVSPPPLTGIFAQNPKMLIYQA